MLRKSEINFALNLKTIIFAINTTANDTKHLHHIFSEHMLIQLSAEQNQKKKRKESKTKKYRVINFCLHSANADLRVKKYEFAVPMHL